MFELSLDGIKKYMDANLILEDITFQVYAGEKVGIVGANGSGKSTILKLIAGIEPMNYCVGYPGATSPGYDEGFISIPRDATRAYLEQIPQYPEGLKVIDVLNLAFEEAHSIEREMHKLEDKMKALEGAELEKVLRQYSDLVQLYEVNGGYDIEEKLGKICTGLKFDDSFLNKDFSLLSGGEKTTVVLGKLLIDNPDILLLDEPTNHLDMDSIEWLEGYLKAYKGIVIIVSHDRYFLDNVVTKIVEIEDMKSIAYKGNYSSYVNQKEENMRIQFQNFREQQKKINAMEKTVKDLRDWAMRADNNKFFRRAASIQIKLDKMDKIEKPIFEKQNMKLNLKSAQRSGNETIKAIELSKSFEDKVIFKDANLLINFSERVALIGPNGCGKTTFLKLLLGEEQPDNGVVELGANVMAAYLPQKITFKNEELTVLECFREDISILEGKAREYLSKFMFYGKSVFKKVKHLSGGEKIRLKLGKLLYEDINLLILDEPTNHLDIDSIETFEEALEEFKGTIFFISHDRYFINKIGERVIAVEDNVLKSYSGNYDYYKSVKDELNLKAPKEPVIKAEKNKKPRNIDESKKKEAEKAKAEKRVESLENEIRELDLAMSNSLLDYEELNKLYCRKEELNKELDIVMEAWLSLEN
ncbi:miro-like family protein [Clostridium argentinense CDC 2741]|uniref:Miro-like family protein n=1 Tax=Clostridium argentinense CDC 2741 TaxID=1418104 RepID=A0A0C1UKG2_9CLOT|nr:ABC-F family ATP-binding cassette domain-containing protein [Clostridium argentinense]ARC86100.1 ABC transporter ATP-binding protein [Clostridium argentinense]KIE47765.1 miro-like family protein [Clostridium argentinense CDC 2741]NFF40391.1 ABC-F family ATP-binding cassette domain-containing protein [Clostridium argentinense]NFP50198.1 ABC-F family ATP-binding cassette domain-containing protein [Clostridium argentinense]NFP72713.1 ABC-F family ATP-binding cassette domain-containing protein 